jgi:hypothetical protein
VRAMGNLINIEEIIAHLDDMRMRALLGAHACYGMIGKYDGVARRVCCNGNSVSYTHIERLIRHIAVRWHMIGLLWVSRGCT